LPYQSRKHKELDSKRSATVAQTRNKAPLELTEATPHLPFKGGLTREVTPNIDRMLIQMRKKIEGQHANKLRLEKTTREKML